MKSLSPSGNASHVATVERNCHVHSPRDVHACVLEGSLSLSGLMFRSCSHERTRLVSLVRLSAQLMSTVTILWSEQLHMFLNGRLRTTPYRVAVKQHPLVTIPQVPLNTQYIIDGVVMAVTDRGDRCGRETFLTVCNHLKSCWGRWLQVVQYVSENAASVGLHLHQHRRYTYGVMAALQDVLLAWYVVDAIIKGGVCQTAVPVASSLLLEELPQLLPAHIPTLCSTTMNASSTIVTAAMLEYRGRFEDLVASWYHQPVATAMRDVLRRCEEVVRRHALAHSDELEHPLSSSALATHPADIKEAPVSPGDMLSIIRSALAGTLHADAVGVVSNEKPTSHASVAKLSGRALVDVFVQQAFERTRTPLSCKHCGVLFPSETALSGHFPTHYATKEQRDTDTAVRLRFPSVDDALHHCPFSSPNAGSAAAQPLKFFCKTTEAHRPFFSATVATRKVDLGIAANDGTTGSGKRPRGTDGVVVTDVAAVYRCAVCGEDIRPMQDVFSRDWVLPRCVKVPNGVVHLGCQAA